jgi:hypothetical protein
MMNGGVIVGVCSPRDEAPLRTLLLVVDPGPVEARAVAIRPDLLSVDSGRQRGKRRGDGAHWDKHTNGSWA